LKKIVDQHGAPIEIAALEEPQTSRVSHLQNQNLTPMLSGLTPARLARTLQDADQGNLLDQHRLFSDMEERDGHLRAEMDKRKNAVMGLPWDIVAPPNATAAEKAAAQWVKEMLCDAVDPVEDLILAAMDAVGHGFSPVEIEWSRQGVEWLPQFHPRPQEWFRLDLSRTQVHLNDFSTTGSPLTPFGWVMHTPGKAKSGYMGRLGLYRTLVWPFIYKSYALGDFAEFLETYGLPIIVGKYFAGATADEKASLMRAVTQLGHDARAIMPKEMEIEIEKVVGGSGDSAHLAMMQWAERSQSKSILGQTLSADTGSKGGGSYSLGKVHNEVRHDIRRSDGRQLAATLTRDVVYPMIALNRSGVDGLARCPRFVFNQSEPEDLVSFADALPKLVGVGFQVPVSWAQERVHIPMPQDGEAVLTLPVQNTPKKEPAGRDSAAALSTVIPTAYVADQLETIAAPEWDALVGRIKKLVEGANDLDQLQRELVAQFGGEPSQDMVSLMAAAFALAELKGMAAVKDGQ